MPKYRVTSPEGKTFEVTAPEGASQDEVLAYAKANMPKGPSMADDFVRPIKGAWNQLKDDTTADLAESGRRARGESKPNLFDVGPGPRLAKNMFALAASPIQGAVDAVAARPAARAAIGAGLPVYERRNPFTIPKEAPRRVYGEEAEATVAGDVSMALSGARAPGPLTKPTPFAATPKPPPPAPRMKPADLAPAKKAAYEAAENTGVAYNKSGVEDLIRGITDEARAANISPARHPKATSMLREIQNMRGRSNTSLTQLDQLRQVIRRDVASSTDAAEAFFGRKMIKGLDEFIDAAGPGQVTAGDPVKGAEALRKARDLNTRYRKVESVEEAVESARLRAGSTGSGGNVDNATRQNLRKVLEDGTWTSEEAKALEEVVMGGQAQNMLRLVGKLSPNGNGLMTALNIGGAAANPLLAIPGMAGVFAKMGADAMTAQKVKKLLDLIANGAPAAAAKSPFRVPNLRPAGATAATNYFARQETREPALAAR